MVISGYRQYLKQSYWNGEWEQLDFSSRIAILHLFVLIPADPHGIQSSKTTGEPPLVLANSVFFAIKQAVTEARKEVGLTGPFTFDSPATVPRIQQACAVKMANAACIQLEHKGERKRLEQELDIHKGERKRLEQELDTQLEHKVL